LYARRSEPRVELELFGHHRLAFDDCAGAVTPADVEEARSGGIGGRCPNDLAATRAKLFFELDQQRIEIADGVLLDCARARPQLLPINLRLSLALVNDGALQRRLEHGGTVRMLEGAVHLVAVEVNRHDRVPPGCMR